MHRGCRFSAPASGGKGGIGNRRRLHLPADKTLESFDLKRLPPRIGQQVRTLADGTFLDRRENVLAFGKPGSGKTHLLSAIDRLVHHAEVINLKGDSYRLKHRQTIFGPLKQEATKAPTPVN